MSFELTDEQRQMSDVLLDLLAARSQSRASFDGGPPVDRGLWECLVELGVIGMSASESLGGAGAGVINEVLVAERLGGAVAAVPLATVSAALLVLEALGTEEARVVAKSFFESGRVVACAVSAERGLALEVQAQQTAEGWRLTGSTADLLEAAGVDTLIVRALTPDGPAYFAVDVSGPQAPLKDQPSLDPTQRLGSIRLSGTAGVLVGRVGEDSRLAGDALARTRVLLAAAAVGSAARTLDITVAYAKQRTAFGQPIGRFQAVKHPLADMLVQVENARSAVYNAAWALDRGDVAEREVLMAKAVATENAVKVVHQAIQSHGGIGFTWEHDLHLHLRRCKSAELALGQPEELFEQIGRTFSEEVGASGLRADAAASAVSDDADFREELRAWLDANLPEGWGTKDFRLPRDPAEHREFMREMQHRFAAGNWVGIHWPREYGGRGATLAQQVIYSTELVRRGIPQMPGHRGLTIVGPTLIEHGTKAQQQRFLERIRHGQDLWAGGFSEPEAGSDLAGLRTRGVLDGDWIVVNGQKIWTSSAHWCNWIFTLVRTDPGAPKHNGISVVAIPLDAAGVSVRPIRQINGASTFNEVFFEDVRVPAGNIIGPVNEGWKVNRTTLSHEHFTLFISSQARYRRSLDDIVALARATKTTKGQLRSADPHICARLGRAWCTSQLIMVNGLRNVARVEAGRPPGAEGSISKVFGQEAEKNLFELAIDIAGSGGLLDRGAEGAVGRGKWLFGYLAARAATIGGGTSEIHKNKIAEGVLGLPRDLWADT